ncbi:MAG TPA: NADH-quinone oxidoreductase subunit N, partial [Candidatus Saccharimonadales bacterium]|nr:NADH-quinone oxidoreductase subunit N [Candidatus Saccharimonadales bacterium]
MQSDLSVLQLEIGVLVLALGVLLLDLWLPPEDKHKLGYAAIVGVGLILLSTFFRSPFFMTFRAGEVVYHQPILACGQSFVLDDLAMFFKRFFLLAAVLVLLMATEFRSKLGTGLSEFYSLILFALAGMMFAASANDFPMLFVSIELITVTFYILTSFQRNRLISLEAGIKYLILGALSSAFMVFGIAFIYGASGTMSFVELLDKAGPLAGKPIFLMGLLLLLAGLAFKIAAFPLQIWAPDVYQGAPAPVTAFLAVGSKAAGFVLLLRVLFHALPMELVARWKGLLMAMSAVTILYGSLCAIPQRNLKRLLGYSSIANAGYLLLGIAALSGAGQAAVLYYLGGYLFTVLAAFTVICLVLAAAEIEDLSALAGLHQRSPLLAGAMTLAMVSLAGIPPLAGFFGKFLLFKAAIEQGPSYYWLIGVAIVGVVISLYYYFGVIRAIYWANEPADLSP